MVWNKWRSVSNCGVLLLGGKNVIAHFVYVHVCLRGNSKYHYYGIRLKPDSPLNRLQEDTQYMAMRQQPVHQKQRWNEHPLSLLLTGMQSSCPRLLCHQDHTSCVCVHVLLNCSYPARALDSSPLFDSLNPCLILSHTGWIDGHADRVLSQTQKTQCGFCELI